MFPVHNSPVAIRLSLPNVCPEEPKPNKAFCARHCTIVEENGIPTKLKDFLAFSGVEGMMFIHIHLSVFVIYYHTYTFTVILCRGVCFQ